MWRLCSPGRLDPLRLFSPSIRVRVLQPEFGMHEAFWANCGKALPQHVLQGGDEAVAAKFTVRRGTRGERGLPPAPPRPPLVSAAAARLSKTNSPPHRMTALAPVPAPGAPRAQEQGAIMLKCAGVWDATHNQSNLIDLSSVHRGEAKLRSLGQDYQYIRQTLPGRTGFVELFEDMIDPAHLNPDYPFGCLLQDLQENFRFSAEPMRLMSVAEREAFFLCQVRHGFRLQFPYLQARGRARRARGAAGAVGRGERGSALGRSECRADPRWRLSARAGGGSERLRNPCGVRRGASDAQRRCGRIPSSRCSLLPPRSAQPLVSRPCACLSDVRPAVSLACRAPPVGPLRARCLPRQRPARPTPAVRGDVQPQQRRRRAHCGRDDGGRRGPRWGGDIRRRAAAAEAGRNANARRLGGHKRRLGQRPEI